MKREAVPEPTARKSAAVLNDLIEVSRDGERLYMDAANKVERPELRELFHEMAAVHQGLIDDLGDHVLERGDAPSAQKIFADALASIAANEPTYVDRLEEAEERLLERYRAALTECAGDPVRAVLAEHLPTVEASHRRMKRLKDLYR